MRVLLDATFASRSPLSGTGLYIERVCRELQRMEGIQLLRAQNGARGMPGGGALSSARNLASDLRFGLLGLQREAHRAGADLIHHALPGPAALSRLPQVVTVADLAYERLPHLFDPGFRRYAHVVHRAAVRRASAVICISRTTAQDVAELWGVGEERIVVARLGPGQELEALEREPEPNHFLYVGDAEPRKNLGLLLDAYGRYRAEAAAPLSLILAGPLSSPPDGAGAGVIVERRPSTERMAELHAQAAALVHPSRYEGFGLSAVEAMSVGTPVLAARAPGVLEVCGEAALYAGPDDPEGFGRLMGGLGGDPALRSRFARLGRARAREFSWAACARAHLEAYSLALGA